LSSRAKNQLLASVPRIRDGLEHLLENDPVFAKTGVDPAELAFPYYGPGFPGLVRIVVGQQVSTAAAASMWKRFREGMPDITPNAVLALKDDEMRGFGLSHQKAKYIRGLAEAIREEVFDPEKLADLTDEDVAAAITLLKGFGGWSAHMYLMFCLARPDVWAPGDLGIQMGLQAYFRLKERPDPKKAEKLGAKFAPHRTAASLLLWHCRAKL
jgi:DNA-3-methyladenine glycosylase II